MTYKSEFPARGVIVLLLYVSRVLGQMCSTICCPAFTGVRTSEVTVFPIPVVAIAGNTARPTLAATRPVSEPYVTRRSNESTGAVTVGAVVTSAPTRTTVMGPRHVHVPMSAADVVTTAAVGCPMSRFARP